MLVVPLVLFSLIPGILGIGDIKLLGRIGGKTFALYMLTTTIAITTALLFATSFGIGKGMTIPTDTNYTGKEAESFSQVLINTTSPNALNIRIGVRLPLVYINLESNYSVN